MKETLKIPGIFTLDIVVQVITLVHLLKKGNRVYG